MRRNLQMPRVEIRCSLPNVNTGILFITQRVIAYGRAAELFDMK